MEGIGAVRLSRRSGSVAGPGPSASPFNGPVRKWKKKWVPSQQPNDIAVTGKANRHRNKPESKSSMLLCRWTRVPSTGNSHDDAPEPTKRKFRYTPVVVLEEKKKEAVRKINAKAEEMKMNQSRFLTVHDDMLTDTPGNGSSEEIEEPDEDEAYFDNLDLQL